MPRRRSKVRFVIVWSITLLASCQALAKTVRRPDGAPPVAYVLALNTANRFLSAWANRDGEAGLSLVSRTLRKRLDESGLRDFVVGLSTPHHAAFEIGAGQRENGERYKFPVVLYETAGGGPDEARGYAGTLEVVREAGKWRVDGLPPTSDNP